MKTVWRFERAGADATKATATPSVPLGTRRGTEVYVRVSQHVFRETPKPPEGPGVEYE